MARRAYMVTVLCIGPNKSGQVRRGVKCYFSSTVRPTLFKFGPHTKPACSFLTVPRSNHMTIRGGGIRASPRFSWRKVWTGVKCNFSSPHQHVRKIARKLSIRRVRMWNFTRIGPKTKKLWLSIVSRAGRLSIPAWDHPKKVWTATFLCRNSTNRTALESFPSLTLKYGV